MGWLGLGGVGWGGVVGEVGVCGNGAGAEKGAAWEGGVGDAEGGRGGARSSKIVDRVGWWCVGEGCALSVSGVGVCVLGAVCGRAERREAGVGEESGVCC